MNPSNNDGSPDNDASQLKSHGYGLMRILRAFRYSLQGVSAAWRHEAAFRQEAVLAVLLTPLAFWLAMGLGQLLLLLGSLVLVLTLELLNSALEALADAITSEKNPLIGRAKDMGSAAVAFGLVIAAGAWGYCLWERFGQG